MDTCVFTETRPEARTKHRSSRSQARAGNAGSCLHRNVGSRRARIHSESGSGEPCAHGPAGTLPSQDHTTTSHCPPLEILKPELLEEGCVAQRRPRPPCRGHRRSPGCWMACPVLRPLWQNGHKWAVCSAWGRCFHEDSKKY